jgi:hypothetical protein
MNTTYGIYTRKSSFVTHNPFFNQGLPGYDGELSNFRSDVQRTIDQKGPKNN